MEVGEVVAKFKLDLSNFNTSINQVTQQLGGMEQQHQSWFAKIKQHWVGLAASATAAYLVIGKAQEYMKLGAMATQAEESFKAVAKSAGESSDRILAAMKKASAGTVDDSDIMQKSIKGMIQGFSGDQLVKIMEAARVSARITGEDVGAAYQKITDAIATNMPRSLKQYGLITKEQMAIVNKAMAQGVEDVDLYTIAMANAALQAAKMGPLQDNVAEAFQRSSAQMHELKETLGTWLIKAMMGVHDSFRLAASAALMVAGSIDSIIASFFSLGETVATFLGQKSIAKSMGDQAKEFKSSAEIMKDASSELFEKVMSDNVATVKSSMLTSQSQIKNAENNVKAWENENKAKASYLENLKFEKEYYELIGDKVKALQKEKELELKQAEKTGASKILIEQKYQQKFINLANEQKAAVLKNENEILSMRQNDYWAEIQLLINEADIREKNREHGFNREKWLSAKITELAQKDFEKRVEIGNKWSEENKKQYAQDLKNWEKREDAKKKKTGITIEESIKQTENEIKEKEELYRKLFYDTGEYAEQYSYHRKLLILSEIDRLKEGGAKEVDLVKYKNEQFRKIDLETAEQRLKRSDDFFLGMRVAYEKELDEQKSWGQQGFQIWKSLFGKGGAIQSTLESFGNDFFKGHLQTLSDYWNSFKDMMIASWVKMLAEMASQWVASEVFKLFFGGNSSLIGNTGGLIPAVAGLFGMTSETTPGASTEGAGSNPVGTGIGALGTAGTLYTVGKAAYAYLTGAPAATTPTGGWMTAVGVGPTGAGAGATAATASGIEVGATEAAGYFAMGQAAGTEAAAGGAVAATAGEGAGALGSAGPYIGPLAAVFTAGMLAYGFYDLATYKRTPNNPFSTFKEPESGLTGDQLYAIGSIMPMKKHGDYDSWKAVVIDQMLGKDIWDAAVNNPVFTPEWAYNKWIQQYGREPNIDDVQFGSAWTWYKQLPEVVQGMNAFAAQVPEWLTAYKYGASPDDIPMSNWYAKGGIINEPVSGLGMWSGKGYMIGEAGPERVTPVNEASTGTTYNLHIHVQGNVIGDERFADEMFHRFKKLEAWGH